MKELFDSIESGAGDKLIQHLDEGKYQFDIAEREFMYKNYNSIFDFFNWRLLRDGSKLPILKSMDKIISSRFRSPVLQKILAYQTVLLGTSPKECPGIYSLMNHIDIDQAIWYPEGGLSAITDSLVRLFEQHGGTLRTAAPAQRIVLDEGVHRATGVELESGEFLPADYVISNADLTFTDEVLLGKAAERDQKYWESKRMSPSGFILYLGVDGEIDTLTHHNLYFIKDWDKGNREVFHGDILPEHPSYYVCCSSKSDKTIAPPGKENLFVLVPVAPGLTVDAATQNAFEDQVLDHMESTLNIPNFRVRIEHKRRYTFENFTEDYNAYKGNALSGMSHTLRQTAVFRPNNIHQTYRNVLFAGAGTNPGIGVPTSLISAEMVYKRIEGITDSSPLDAL
jgi:phytoene desaturase